MPGWGQETAPFIVTEHIEKQLHMTGQESISPGWTGKKNNESSLKNVNQGSNIKLLMCRNNVECFQLGEKAI